MSHSHNLCLTVMPEEQIGENESNATKLHMTGRELDSLLKTIK